MIMDLFRESEKKDMESTANAVHLQSSISNLPSSLSLLPSLTSAQRAARKRIERDNHEMMTMLAALTFRGETLNHTCRSQPTTETNASMQSTHTTDSEICHESQDPIDAHSKKLECGHAFHTICVESMMTMLDDHDDDHA